MGSKHVLWPPRRGCRDVLCGREEGVGVPLLLQPSLALSAHPSISVDHEDLPHGARRRRAPDLSFRILFGPRGSAALFKRSWLCPWHQGTESVRASWAVLVTKTNAVRMCRSSAQTLQRVPMSFRANLVLSTASTPPHTCLLLSFTSIQGYRPPFSQSHQGVAGA